MIDVAIVGGGVAGCYCAYRLTHAGAAADVRVFEGSGRIGGRLWSAPLADYEGPPAEIGGMYFKELHANVRGLIEHLGLRAERVNFTRKHQFLRGKFLDDSAYASGGQTRTPFGLRSDERGKHPADLLAHALEKIAPGLMDLWPVNKAASCSPQATFRFLRNIRHQGRPLEDCGLWNVLADVASSEAHAILASVWGSVSLFRNINAFDGVWNLLHEIGEGRAFKLADGYQRLPLELQKHAESTGATFHLRHRLRHVRRQGDAFRLSFEAGDGGQRVEYARRLILAMPRRALQLVSLHADLFLDFDEFQRIRDCAVLPMRSCKVFLTFDTRWWEDSIVAPGALATADVAAAYTDLPMQQCYYFGGCGQAPALLMAAYADDVAASFWAALASSGSRDFTNAAKNSDDVSLLGASEVLVASVRRQLSAMHHDAEAPLPKGAMFFDWGNDPYGAAWHGWAPHFKSWEIRPWMRQPNPSLDLFICGEAYSQRNGWVEGAINSAEKALERFGLTRPEWINDPDFQFEIGDEGEKEDDKRIKRTAVRAV